MPQVYVDPNLRVRPHGAIFGLPLRAVRNKLDYTQRQKLIPFLGAGASLQKRSEPPLIPPRKRPGPKELDSICQQFEISSELSKRFVDVALQFAQILDQLPKDIDSEVSGHAPDSWQLAMRLARILNLEPLQRPARMLKKVLNENPERGDYLDIIRRVAEVIGLAKSVPQLLTVASYFNVGGARERLQEDLSDLFKQVTDFTPIQERIAQKAKKFVDVNNADESLAEKENYLIITTNYDQLMEVRLQQLDVPTCVLTVDRKSRVLTEFMKGTQDFLKLSDNQFAALKKRYQQDANDLDFNARQFGLSDKSHSLAMVYKIHGCPLIDEQRNIDNIIISDQDYVVFIKRNGDNNDLIPAYVVNRVRDSRFLFLGYSFSDWNVRNIYKQFVRDRKASGPDEYHDERDYVVLNSYDDSENYFLRDCDISILLTELDDFACAV